MFSLVNEDYQYPGEIFGGKGFRGVEVRGAKGAEPRRRRTRER